MKKLKCFCVYVAVSYNFYVFQSIETFFGKYFQRSWPGNPGQFPLVSLYILEQLPPPGEWQGMTQTPSVGYHRIRLDPQGPKKSWVRKISGPDQRGSRQQVPGGPGPGHPQESIFWESCRIKGCSACKTGLV